MAMTLEPHESSDSDYDAFPFRAEEFHAADLKAQRPFRAVSDFESPTEKEEVHSSCAPERLGEELDLSTKAERIHLKIDLEPRTAQEEVDLRRTAARLLQVEDTESPQNPITAMVLANRGVSSYQEFKRFISPDLDSYMATKHQLLGLEQGVEIVAQSFERDEKIAVFCDFDCDGTTSAAQFYKLSKYIDLEKNLLMYPADRYETGHQFTIEMVEKVHRRGAKTILVQDMGIQCHEAIARAQELGMKVVMIDHHEFDETQEIPKVDALIEPHQPGCGWQDGSLCASGLTYVFCAALKERLGQSPLSELKEKSDSIKLGRIIQAAATGTVGDVMDLRGFNRALVRAGLKEMNEDPDDWVLAMRVAAKLKGAIRSEVIAFQIAPRLNASGRMVDEGVYVPGDQFMGNSESREVTLKELLGEEKGGRTSLYEPEDLLTLREKKSCSGAALTIKALVTDAPPSLRKEGAAVGPQAFGRLGLYMRTISWLNGERKRLLNKAATEIVNVVNPAHELLDPIVIQSDLNAGLRGLFGSKIVEAFRGPTIVFSPDGGASGRAPEGVDILEVSKYARRVAEKFGGHTAACGARVKKENILLFKDEFERGGAEFKAANPDIRPDIIGWDAEITLNDLRGEVGFQLVKDMARSLEPTGKGNPGARLLLRGVNVSLVDTLSGRDTEFYVNEGSNVYYGIDVLMKLWGIGDHPALIEGRKVHIVGRPRIYRRDLNEAHDKLHFEVEAVQSATPEKIMHPPF